jgi:GTPase SAR1 family protein
VIHTQLSSLQWYPEVTHFCKGVPIIVVGCKIDLRKDKVLVNNLRKKRLEPVTYHRVGRKLGNLWILPHCARCVAHGGLGGCQQSGRGSTWKQNPECSRRL